MRRSLPTLLASVCLCLACGGSGSSGGGGASVISQGAITSTSASIVVTGTHYEVPAEAEIILDGVAGGVESDLQPGMVVRVSGTRIGTAGSAESVEFDDAIEGPVETKTAHPTDASRADLSILDQTVVIEEGFTLFAGTSFAALDVDDVVEVSGYRASDGVITATRVEFVSTDPTPDVELKGVVSNLAADSFEIGAILVDYDETTTTFEPADLVLMEGDFVEVEGGFDGASTVDATAGVIELEEVDDADFPAVELEGIVSDFASLVDFEVSGLPVVAAGVPVRFEPLLLGTSLVKEGARIELEGRLQNGFLVATRVVLRGGDAKLDAAIVPDAIDAGARTLRLLGRIETVMGEDELVAGALVDFDDGTRFDPDCEGFDELLAGDFVRVRGVRSAATRLLATEIACDAVAGSVRIRGPVQSFDGTLGNVTILGARFGVDGGTSLLDFPPGVDDVSDFFLFLSSNPNALLLVTLPDSDPTTPDVALEIEYEEDD